MYDYSKDIKSAAQLRAELRQDIQRTAGDAHSLLGTTADSAQILLYEVAKLAVKLNAAQSLADVRKSAQSLNDLIGPLAENIDKGESKLPYQTKEVSEVISEIERRATAVADVLQQAKGDK